MSDSVWIASVLAGHPADFAHLVDRYQRPVYSLALNLLGHRDDAADAAQETFLRAFTQLARYDAGRPFGTWLLSIAAHHCIDVLRKRRHETTDLGPAETQIDRQPGPEEAMLDGERRDTVRALLDHLAPPYRLVVVLRYWHEKSYEEIAAIAGLSVPNVKTRLHRARALLVKAANPASFGRKKYGDERSAVSRSQAAAVDAPRRGIGNRPSPPTRGPSQDVQFLRVVRLPA